jgi:hypothetical protein
MITMLVWVLVAVGGNKITYSPALPTEAECLRVKEEIKKSSGRNPRSICVQMTIVK